MRQSQCGIKREPSSNSGEYGRFSTTICSRRKNVYLYSDDRMKNDNLL